MMISRLLPKIREFSSGYRLFSSSAATVPNLGEILSSHDPVQVQSMNEEIVPVVNERDQVIDTRSKSDCHLMTNINAGMLHRAFSVLLFNSKDEFLLTQRSDTKITFPGVFTNAVCSHPSAREDEMDKTNNFIGIKRAAKRRLVQELGIQDNDLHLDDIKFMTRFIYKAASDDPIWGEHELDYILIIKKDLNLNPNVNELKFWKFLDRQQLDSFMRDAEDGKIKVSQWFYKIYKLWLNDYWNNLDNLKSLKDHDTIHTRKIKFRGIDY